jgi:hypothetical protein
MSDVNDFDKKEWEKGLTEEERIFQEDIFALTSLLKEPHPGLASWNIMRTERAKSIYMFLKKQGF